MRRTVFWVLFSMASAAAMSEAEARKKRHAADSATEAEPSAPDPAPALSAAGPTQGIAPGPAAASPMPGPPAPGPAMGGQPLPPGAMPAMPPMAGTQPGPASAPASSGSGHSTPWKVAVAGGGIIGGSYVLSLIVGSMSYAGFNNGQAGWFAPVVGPALAMGSVGGDAGGCLSKAAYTYTLGPILTLFTLGGIGTAIGGIVGMFSGMSKSVSTASNDPPPPQVQVAPSLTPGGAGLIVLGSF